MAATEQSNEGLIDDLFLAEDNLADGGADSGQLIAERLDFLRELHGIDFRWWRAESRHVRLPADGGQICRKTNTRSNALCLACK